MSMNGVSAATALSAGQSQPPSVGQAKHRKHPSVSDVAMQDPSAQSAPVASGRPGSKVNITA